MYILIDRTGETRLMEPLDFKSFKIVLEASDLLVTENEVVQFENGSHGWVSIDFLRDQGKLIGDFDWSNNFDAMVAYAAKKNWLDPSGVRLRGHLDISGTSCE